MLRQWNFIFSLEFEKNIFGLINFEEFKNKLDDKL
jgi:hypothetical protein